MLEAVYEGYLLHYGESRLFAGMDDDLRLLAGDALYALGLARLAEAGDLAAVAELSDLISRSLRRTRRVATSSSRSSGRRARAPWRLAARASCGPRTARAPTCAPPPCWHLPSQSVRITGLITLG